MGFSPEMLAGAFQKVGNSFSTLNAIRIRLYMRGTHVMMVNLACSLMHKRPVTTNRNSNGHPVSPRPAIYLTQENSLSASSIWFLTRSKRAVFHLSSLLV